MQAECPNCHTLFRVTETQLDMADGMVRCGFCKQVFNARLANDEDTSREETQQPQLSRQIKAEHEAFHSGTSDDNVPDTFRIESPAGTYSMLATVSWSLAILLLIAALAAEYIWFNQPELMLDPRLEPVTAKLCELTDCKHLQLRDVSKIEMVSRNVYTHPNEKDALMVSTTLVNHANYEQPFPDVQIDFSNVRGELVASRRFIPEEYLQTDSEQLIPLQPGNPITFGLEIVDPGKEAITYEFSFH
jgi:predicted Zn finger-like uncharacterized protein